MFSSSSLVSTPFSNSTLPSLESPKQSCLVQPNLGVPRDEIQRDNIQSSVSSLAFLISFFFQFPSFLKVGRKFSPTRSKNVDLATYLGGKLSLFPFNGGAGCCSGTRRHKGTPFIFNGLIEY